MNDALTQKLANLAEEFAGLLKELKAADTSPPTEEQVQAIVAKLQKLPPRYVQSAADYIDFLAKRKQGPGGLGGPGGHPTVEYP